jgi:LytS/YehU family sensor histidine kinase
LKQDKQTANGITVLASMMRYSLNTGGEGGLVPLADEVEQVENYIHLQQLRFDSQLHIQFTQSEIPETITIIPHALITLVENAFKHGVTDDPTHPLQVTLDVNHHQLMFTVSNKPSAQKKDVAGSGIGLQNLLNRLQTVYPGQHQYTVLQDENRYTTRLVIEHQLQATNRIIIAFYIWYASRLKQYLKKYVNLPTEI